MATDKRLPATEFELMKLIWAAEEPVTTAYLMKRCGNERGWRTPTLITLLNRLIERGLLTSEKPAAERIYSPLVGEEAYMRSELAGVASRYDGRLAGLFCALAGRGLSDADADELERWFAEKSGGEK